MKKIKKKTIVRLNRIPLFLTILGCIIGTVLCILMFFVLEKETSVPEEGTGIFAGQIIFLICAVLLIFSTFYFIIKWYITISFTEEAIKFDRAFERPRSRPYQYYKYIYFGYKAKTGNLIADSRKTYYVVITNQFMDETDLKHIDSIEMSYNTIKLLFTEELCENLNRVFPDTHKKMLSKAVEGIKKDSMML